LNFDVKDIIILVQLSIIVFMFFSSRNDVSPIALKGILNISFRLLKEYADKTPTSLDNTILDFADNLINNDDTTETTEVQSIKIKKDNK